MGLFSAKKDPATQDSDSVLRVLRSRFYGKRKFSERLSPKIFTSPTKRNRTENCSVSAPSSPLQTNAKPDIAPSRPRPASDVITMTLAQRLNELALANFEGLLDDDGYRLLRQNLFERFASGATVPVETPVVPVTGQTLRKTDKFTAPDPSISNFHVSTRPPSLRSKASVSTTMTSLFRRATGRASTRTSQCAEGSDSSSLFSNNSAIPPAVSRTSISSQVPLRKTSNLSLRTAASRKNFETSSLMSRVASVRSGRNGLLDSSNNPSTTSLSRSTRRGLPSSPPSSFPSRLAGLTASQLHSRNLHGMYDAEHLKVSADIRQEIAAVEGEKKRLLDAFNGLEISTLTRRQHRSGPSPVARDAVESTWTLIPDHKSDRKPVWRGTDSDSASIFSAESSRTTPSLATSPHSIRRPLGASNADASSVTAFPPSGSQIHLDAASGPRTGLARSTSHRAFRPVEGGDHARSAMCDGNDVLAVETEMEEIRRRREDVMGRYDARLDYLRAKLKGAEIHETLLRK